MKKILVLAALAALVSTTAFAGNAAISGTKHNLRSAGTANTFKSANLDEICVFCHTPHGANAAAVSYAPLWNRTLASAPTKYSSNTLTTSANAAAQLSSSDAVLCLSCHDGASMGAALQNNPNSLAGAVTWSGGQITGNANIGTTLSNDHPVGFDFAAANTDDNDIKAPTNTAVKVTFGASGNAMWCSSCHDVHNDTHSPFLAINNTGSALCLECHSK